MRHAAAIALAALALPSGATAQERIDRRGTVAHAPAGTGFAERVGDFRRTSVVRFDPAGDNLSAGYSLDRPEGRVALTVYIYPSPRAAGGSGSGDAAARATLCAREFEDVRQAIAIHHGELAPADAGAPEALPGTDPALSHRAAFRFRTDFDGRTQEVRSEARLYCYVAGRWQVKYRVTAPAGVQADAEIDAFVRQGPWPGRTAAPAPNETVARPSRDASAS